MHQRGVSCHRRRGGREKRATGGNEKQQHQPESRLYFSFSSSSPFFCLLAPCFIALSRSDSRTEEEERKRRLTLIFGIVGLTLFLLAVLMVGIGLKMNSYIDNVCK